MSGEASTIWRGCSGGAAETMSLGAAIGRSAREGDVIALFGELGAGKTQLVRGLAEGMGLDPSVVASPTFVMSHEYEPASPESPVLVHLDAYRLQGAGESDSIGLDPSSLSEGGELRQDAVVVIEWGERVRDVLPIDRLEVWLGHAGENQRRIECRGCGRWRKRLEALRGELDGAAKGE